MLVGRADERGAIEQALVRARSGVSAVLALAGEPGIGKTALLDHAARQATGMRVLRARGIESEAQIAFGSLLELIRPALPLLEAIPAPQAAALEAALSLRPAVAQDRFAVGAATLSLLCAYADQMPLAVLVDDAHWLDGSSAATLLFAFRRLVADPVAVLIAVRDAEPSLLDGADLPVLRIGGLSQEDAAQLAPGLPPEAVRRLHQTTAGNPLALRELAADAIVDAEAERQVLIAIGAMDVEHLAVLEHRLVAIGGALQQQQVRSLGNLDPANHGIGQGPSAPDDHRGGEA